MVRISYSDIAFWSVVERDGRTVLRAESVTEENRKLS